MLKSVYKKVTEDIWHYSDLEDNKIKAYFLRLLKIIILTAKGFRRNNCYLKASALTFYTIFSVVPVVALAFAVAKGFGLEQRLKIEIIQKLQNQQQILDKVISFADNLLARTQGGLIAGVGAILLLWTIIKLFSNIEWAFNEIWGVKKGRIFLRKVTDYLSMFFICPILLVVSASFTAFLSSNMRLYFYLPKFIVIFIPTAFSYISIWFLLTFVYRIIPNCKMKLYSAIIPAVIVGTLFNIIQFTYFDLQIFITKYNTIYGSFAALPLFLMWVQINWIIVLVGAQLSFYIDSIELHEHDYSIDKISFRQRKIIALMEMKAITENFKVSDKPISAKELSATLRLPFNLTKDVLDNLVAAKALSLVHEADKSFAGYQPSRCITKISINHLLSKLESINTMENLNFSYLGSDKIEIIIKTLEREHEDSDSNILIKDI